MKAASMLRSVSITALLAVLTIASVEAGPTRQPRTRVRFINGVPGLTKVDMRLDDSVIFGQVPYGVITGYESVNDGDYSLDVTTLRAQTTVIPPVQTDLDDSDEDYTILCFGSISGNPKIDVVNLEWNRLQTLSRNETDIVFINSCPDSGPVDLFVDGTQYGFAVPLSNVNGPTSFAPGTHLVEVKVGGNTIASGSFRMQGGATNTILFTGTTNPSDGFPILLKNFTSH